MSQQISWDLEVQILPGKLEEFRAVARDLIAATESEEGALSYEWKLSIDETVCHIYERYKDSEAVIAHVRAFGAFGERFMQACHPIRCQVCGSPSEEARAAIADLQPVYFSWLGGFNRNS
jgi:quinol monooxygenase YgiN